MAEQLRPRQPSRAQIDEAQRDLRIRKDNEYRARHGGRNPFGYGDSLFERIMKSMGRAFDNNGALGQSRYTPDTAVYREMPSPYKENEVSQNK